MSVLPYRCTTWTRTKSMAKTLDGTTQECCKLFWTCHGGITLQNSICMATYHPSVKLSKLDEPDIRDTAGEVRTTLISDILQWTPSHEWAKAGRPARTYIQQLCANTGYSLEDLPTAMDDRDGWRERVREIRAGHATWWWFWARMNVACDKSPERTSLIIIFFYKRLNCVSLGYELML